MFAMDAQVAPPFVDDSQRIIVPCWPVRVSEPLDPLHMETEGSVPPAAEGCTVIVPLGTCVINCTRNSKSAGIVNR